MIDLPCPKDQCIVGQIGRTLVTEAVSYMLDPDRHGHVFFKYCPNCGAKHDDE